MFRPYSFACIYFVMISSFAMEPSENPLNERIRLNPTDFRYAQTDSEKLREERLNKKKLYVQPQDDQDNIEKSAEKYEGRTCPICFEDFKETDKRITLLPKETNVNGPKNCGHEYHKDCIVQYHNVDRKAGCPMCRNKDFRAKIHPDYVKTDASETISKKEYLNKFIKQEGRARDDERRNQPRNVQQNVRVPQNFDFQSSFNFGDRSGEWPQEFRSNSDQSDVFNQFSRSPQESQSRFDFFNPSGRRPRGSGFNFFNPPDRSREDLGSFFNPSGRRPRGSGFDFFNPPDRTSGDRSQVFRGFN
jgi:hypothetical protein